MYWKFIAGQKAEEACKWREARDFYTEAGANRSAAQMQDKLSDEMEDRLVLSMISDGHESPRGRWADGLA